MQMKKRRLRAHLLPSYRLKHDKYHDSNYECFFPILFLHNIRTKESLFIIEFFSLIILLSESRIFESVFGIQPDIKFSIWQIWSIFIYLLAIYMAGYPVSGSIPVWIPGNHSDIRLYPTRDLKLCGGNCNEIITFDKTASVVKTLH